MKAVLFLLLTVFLVMAVSAQTLDPDTVAWATAQQRWPFQGYVVKSRGPYADGFTYEVGRIEVFGRRLSLGQGGSWKDAFEAADRAAELEAAPHSVF